MADSPKMQALTQLAGQMPVANSRIAQGQQQARALQLQQAVGAAPASTNAVQSAQQTGAASAAMAGQQAVQTAQNAAQASGQVAQLGAEQQKQESQAQIASAQQGARQQEMDQTKRLAALDSRAKQEVYDKQINFSKDQAGRTLFNERQLADYAKQKAISDEQYKDYAQAAIQSSERNIQAMETAQKLLEEDLMQKWTIAEQNKDQDAKERIAAARQDMENRINSEKAKAANTRAMWQAGGTIVGAAIGSYGGPAGASAGASLGGAAGGLAGNEAAK